MGYNSNLKLEPRGEKDPKFNPHNKTDRKIMLAVTISSSILILIIIGLFFIYFNYFHV